MKRLISKLLRKKNNGQGELISSLFVIMALVVILLISVEVVRDISKITFVDQVARQCIIKLEIQGKLSGAEINEIKKKLQDGGIIFNDEHTINVNGTNVKDGVYVAYKNNNSWVIDTTNSTYNLNSLDYGDEIGIYIQCQAETFSFSGNIFNGNRTKRYTNITRLKTSITKKAN